MRALHRAQGLLQKINRDVHRHVALRRQGVHQAHGFGAIACAQINQRADVAHALGHRSRVPFQNLSFGARRVVLVQLRDGFKQARAQGVVQEFR